MKKTLFAFMIVLALCFTLAGCGSDADDTAAAPSASAPVVAEQPQEEPEAEPAPATTPKELDAIAEALGLTDKGEVYFSILGAADGAEYNGGDIELYIFEDTANESYAGFEANSGMYGTAYCKDGVALVFLDGVEPDAGIVEAFEALVF